MVTRILSFVSETISRNTKILIIHTIDDDEVFSAILKLEIDKSISAMHRKGVDAVRAFTDVDALLQHIDNTQSADIYIIDLYMLPINGIELIKYLHSKYFVAYDHIILSTAQTDNDILDGLVQLFPGLHIVRKGDIDWAAQILDLIEQKRHPCIC